MEPASSQKLAVLHVALNPITGVWSVMKGLASAQAKSGLYASVGIGIIADNAWPQLCADEFRDCGLPTYRSATPKIFGTAQFMLQRILRPPIDAWVRDLLQRSGADCCIVHFHNAWLSGVFLPLETMNEGLSRPVATVHGVNASFQGQPVRQAIHRRFASRLLRHHAALSSVDSANLERARRLLNLPPERFSVIPNGIDDTPLRACPRLSGATHLTLGHVGSMMAAKGWRILVEAAVRARAKHHPVKVILAGRGPDDAEARTLAAQHSDWLEFRGFVSNPRETLLPQLDALVLMSEQEGLPMSIVESLSIGLPVVATRVGGIPEAIQDGRNGLLVPRTVEDLERAIESLMDHPDRLPLMSRLARAEFDSRFEISTVVSQYHSLYQSHP